MDDELKEELQKTITNLPDGVATDLVMQIKSGNISLDDAISEAHHQQF